MSDSSGVFDVAVAGSGFAGSILARALRRQGLRVALLERERHPRFALGESSTPLANFCLERLARRYDLPDLHQLAAYGRWRAAHPRLRRGLKRGFSFFFHRPGEDYTAGAGNRHRLLVAASPDDEIADSHWLREDVDAFLAARAVAEGVTLREGFAIAGVERGRRGFELSATGGERIVARFVVDATGPRGVVGEALGAGRRSPPARFRSRLVYGHFAGVGALAPAGSLEPGPYPDEKAAVHHLLAEGWMYVLPFDHDCVSAGLVLTDPAVGVAAAADPPEKTWQAALARYPSLRRQFAGARPLRPLARVDPLQHRRRRAAAGVPVGEGEGPRGWALLPHAYAFFDPMFSTGIAWSLLGVERLARILGSPVAGDGGERDASRLVAYDSLLRREAEQIERLIHGAYLAGSDSRLLTSHSFLYFAVVSFEELRQRLLGVDPAAGFDRDGGRHPGGGFLGAGEPGRESLFEEAVSRLAGIARCAGRERRARVAGFERWVRASIAPWNLVGLADPARRNLYPVDLEVLCARSRLLGLTRREMEGLLPRLRGGAGPPPRQG